MKKGYWKLQEKNTTVTLTHPCLLNYYIQEPSYGNNHITYNWWMDWENVYMYTVEHYLAIKKNEIMCTGKWMEL
jgi:hypothetical protein